MKYPVLYLLFALLLFTQCRQDKQEKIREEKAIVETLALILESGHRYEKQMHHLNMQEGHQIVWDSSFIWSVMLECRDSIAEADKPFRTQIEAGITRLQQMSETDASAAPLKYALANFRNLLSCLDSMKVYMDTSLTWTAHRAVRLHVPELRESAAAMVSAINEFNKKWDIHDNDDEYLTRCYYAACMGKYY